MVEQQRVVGSVGRGVALTAVVLGAVIAIRLAMGWAILWNWVLILGLMGTALLSAVEWIRWGDEPGNA